MGIITKHNPIDPEKDKKEDRSFSVKEIWFFIVSFLFAFAACCGLILLLKYLTNN